MIKRTRQHLVSLTFTPKSSPIIILIVTLLAFGLLSPWLGFYQDDWHFIYYADTYGLKGLWKLSAFDNRPFAAWPYISGFALLGFRPFAWQVAAITLRWLTGVSFWMLYRTLWHKREQLAVTAALLFTIYPLFTLQPMAVTYITHWTCYLLFGISLWLMAAAIRKPSIFWPAFLLSVLLDGVQLFTIEYFNGVELLRPVILWILLIKPIDQPAKRPKKTALLWLPYFLLLLAFVIWRAFLFTPPGVDTNAPTVLNDLLTSPSSSIGYLVSAAIKDSMIILINAWANLFQPKLMSFTPSGLLILLVITLSFFLFVFYFKRQSDEKFSPSTIDLYQILGLGLLGVLFGPIPAWITNQPLYDTNPLWNSRLGMASMFGAALVVTALVELLIRARVQRQVIYSILISFSIGFLLTSANGYRYSWISQRSFYNQLAWRAPSIKAGTPMISQREILSLMGDYPTAFAMNVVYKPSTGMDQIPLWYFPTSGSDKVTEELLGRQEMSVSKFSVTFEGKSENSLFMIYEPNISQCLHFVTEDDANTRIYSDFIRQFSVVSSVERIRTESNLNETFINQAFGNSSRDWCYYFQKAELAVQNQQWDEVVQIWNARQNDLAAPSSGLDYLPFIRGFLMTQRLQEAKTLTMDAAKETNSRAMRNTLCSLWLNMDQTSDQSEIKPIQDDVLNLLRCNR